MDRRRILIIGTIGLVMLVIAGVLFYRSMTAPPGLPAQYYAPHTASGSVPSLDHIVIIVEENKVAGSVIGSDDAPYTTRLAQQYTLATKYYAITHPSLPNYIALTSGTTAGITTDCNPPGGSCIADVHSIADEIEASGRTWKMYAESMPAPCSAANSGDYAVKHNPFMYYPDIKDDAVRCNAHDVPFTQFAADLKSTSTLPNYAFISPNLCNDMHNCSVKTGDTWLSQQVPRILASPAFTQQHSLLVITWDEGVASDNNVAAIFAGPAVKKSFTTGTYYSHYSLLRTIEDSWHLQPLTDNDRTAPAITDIFH